MRISIGGSRTNASPKSIPERLRRGQQNCIGAHWPSTGHRNLIRARRKSLEIFLQHPLGFELVGIVTKGGGVTVEAGEKDEHWLVALDKPLATKEYGLQRVLLTWNRHGEACRRGVQSQSLPKTGFDIGQLIQVICGYRRTAYYAINFLLQLAIGLGMLQQEREQE